MVCINCLFVTVSIILLNIIIYFLYIKQWVVICLEIDLYFIYIHGCEYYHNVFVTENVYWILTI